MKRGYGEDLSHIHDVGFGGLAEHAAKGLPQVFRENQISDGLVIDVGCGSGIWAKALVDHGYKALGIDQSASMIDIARQRVPEAEFRTESFLTSSLPPCKAITALGEVLNYQFDERNSRDALIGFFNKTYHALEPGGLFVFDLAGPGRNKTTPQLFRDSEDWTCLVQHTLNESNDFLSRSIITYRKVGDLYRRDEETHEMQLYPPDEIVRELQQIGFEVQTVDRYGEFVFPDALIGYVCRKK